MSMDNQNDRLAEDGLIEQKKQREIAKLAAEIDLTSSNSIMNYGVSAQKKVADFSEDALSNVRTKDLGEVGALLTDMIGELKKFDAGEEEKKGFFRFFKRRALI